MVNFSTIAIIGGGALLFIFRKDVSGFLDTFKGFGANIGSGDINLPDININIPDFGLPSAFAETGKNIGAGLGEAGANINQFGIDVQKNIADAFDEAGKTIDTSIKETQENFEQFGKDVQTNIGIIQGGIDEAGKGITDFFGGIFNPKEVTTVSETAPTIVPPSRRSGKSTRFGGQSTPKEILTVGGTGTSSDPFKAEQPDKSLVSPFLTGFKQDIRLSADPDKVPANFFQGIPIASSRTTTGRRFGGRS